ncbi:MAG: hypothetical protein ACXVEF_04020 [Polyangiales bacterium]
MSSKLEQFLSAKKIDQRQLLVVSHDLESLRVEDRAIKLGKRKKEGEEKKAEAGAPAPKKPRSGRPVTKVTLSKIFAGKDVTGPTKTRVLRAVNTILERKKQSAVQLADLFDFAKKEG